MFLLIYFCTILLFKVSFLFTLENFALQMFLSIYILQFCLTNAFSYLNCTILIHKHPPDLHCWVFSTNVSPYLHCTILFYKCSSIVTLYNLLYSYSSLFSLYNFTLQMFLLIYMAQFPTQYILWHADIPIPYYVYSIMRCL